MKETLEKLFSGEILTREEAAGILREITAEGICSEQVAAFLAVYRMREVRPEEFLGFREVMLERCVPLECGEKRCVDVCGTGGDGKNTFNISTLAAFVVAGAGVKVAKHGNYSVSSHCGSSNVLENLGAKFSNDQSIQLDLLDTAGVCYLHAPLYHPAMKYVGPVRKALGVKTIFNLLGPLSNPARPSAQLIGVADPAVGELYAEVLSKTEVDFTIVHSLDGYDEVSLTGPFFVKTREGTKQYQPKDLGFKQVAPEDLNGGNDIEGASSTFEKILVGEGSEAQNSVVTANAALAIQCASGNESLENSIESARDSLSSGRAAEAFKAYISGTSA